MNSLLPLNYNMYHLALHSELSPFPMNCLNYNEPIYDFENCDYSATNTTLSGGMDFTNCFAQYLHDIFNHTSTSQSTIVSNDTLTMEFNVCVLTLSDIYNNLW